MLLPCFVCLMFLAPPPQDGPTVDAVPDELLTVAERSGFRATARHAEVVALTDALAEFSPLATRASLGTTFEGREIPLLIVSDPPVGSAVEAHELVASQGRVVAFVFGNIHAGEVCGKEASLMLARDLLLAPDEPRNRALLDHLVLLIAPIYNADGNERFALDNRPGQVGPEQGMGIRRNAQDLDLNRDYMKLEAPESQAMVAALNAWDPHLIMDLHTTNGSLHRYHLTYSPPLNPSGPGLPISLVRDKLLPAVTARLEAEHGWRSFSYGNFAEDHAVWATYSSLPRFGAQYHGLRGHLSILSEAYAYATYEERVLATRDFVRECLSWCAENRHLVRLAVRSGRRRVIDAGEQGDGTAQVGLRFELAANATPAVLLGFEETVDADGRVVSTGVPRDYTVEHRDHFVPTVTVGRPWGYLVAPGEDDVLELLRRHGVEVQPARFDPEGLRQDRHEAESYRVGAVHRDRDPYLGHEVIDLEVTVFQDHRLPEDLDGWHLVRTAQPLGTLIVYLLEPRSDDGLAAAGLVEEHLQPGATWPVRRVVRFSHMH